MFEIELQKYERIELFEEFWAFQGVFFFTLSNQAGLS